MSSGITCPVDHNDMVENEFDGTTSFQCLECTGQLIQLGTQLKADTIPDLNPTAVPSFASVDCPLCKTTMLEHHFKSIEIDLCPNCPTIWLDPGELKRVVPDHDNDKAASKFGAQLFDALQNDYLVLPYADSYKKTVIQSLAKVVNRVRSTKEK